MTLLTFSWILVRLKQHLQLVIVPHICVLRHVEVLLLVDLHS